MNFIFDSRNPVFKTPFGCVALGEKMVISVYSDEPDATHFLLIQKDGGKEERLPMRAYGEEDGYKIYSVSFEFPSAGLYFYRFYLCGEGWEESVGRGPFNMPESGGVQAWQTLCYDAEIRPPERFCGAVYYQIFPDRFYQQGECDLKDKLTPFWIHQDKRETPQYLPDEHGEIKNNDYYGGNLRGICAKLDYLASIGTEVIYLNPIFMAFSNHRYDTADYKRVDPMLGTEQDFRELCSAAHELGMKIILDGVFSHTGSNSVYFDQHGHFGGGAANDPDSPYREWYRFSRYPDEYESWWGIRTLPCVDELNPGYLDFVVTGENSVVRQWLRLGADGYRLDVADELPDEFLEILYRTVKEEKPDAVVLGEVWEDASNKVSYGARRKYLRGKQLDGVMNYVYRGAIIDFVTGTISAETFLEEVMQLAENYPKETLDCSMNLLSTHDTGRILTMLAGPDGNRMSRDERAAARLDKKQYQEGVRLLSAAVFLLFTLPGSPCIYYGDEIGMQGYEDPFNRRFYDWESGDENIRDIYAVMALARKTSAALRTGKIDSCAAQEGFVSFYREDKGERLLCAVNVSEHTVCVPVRCTEVRQGTRFLQNGDKITLFPFGSGIFVPD